MPSHFCALVVALVVLSGVACGPSRGAPPLASRAGDVTATTSSTARAAASNDGAGVTGTPARPSAPAEDARPAGPTVVSEASSVSTPTPSAPASVSNVRADLTRLPIGDGRVSTSPRVGSVYSCQTSFGGGGASRDGSWIRGDGTFDLTAKLAVRGAIRQVGDFGVSLSGATRRVTGNGLPQHATGQFPVAPSDPAYQYDRNPNTTRAQALAVSLPMKPVQAAQPSCLSLGAIGVSLNGVVFFNALDALGRDAVAHEVLDSCEGHPERSGQYHYHNHATCLDDPGMGHSTLVGYAYDGFGIFGRRGEAGRWLADTDLDVCHGHVHTVIWDGDTVTLYHYHTTDEYPYTLGCYRGTPVRNGS